MKKTFCFAEDLTYRVQGEVNACKTAFTNDQEKLKRNAHQGGWIAYQNIMVETTLTVINFHLSAYQVNRTGFHMPQVAKGCLSISDADSTVTSRVQNKHSNTRSYFLPK